MKNKYLYFLILCLYLISSNTSKVSGQQKLEGHLSLSGAFALYPMSVKWAEEFRKINPDVKIDISAGGAGKGITDVLNNMVDIGMVSRDVYAEEITKGAFPISVTKDAVVAVISSQNPAMNEILKKGLNKEAGIKIWISGEYTTWTQGFGINARIPLHIYTRSDACGAAETWAKYLGSRQEDLLGNGVYGDPGLALAVKKDPLGIGFNNIAYAYDFSTKKPVPGIRVLPLDLNDNGKIDPEENFYDNMDNIINAVANGTYPSPPARELYFVTKNKPDGKLLVEFIKWVLTDGQKFVPETGYINLSQQTLDQGILKIK